MTAEERLTVQEILDFLRSTEQLRKQLHDADQERWTSMERKLDVVYTKVEDLLIDKPWIAAISSCRDEREKITASAIQHDQQRSAVSTYVCEHWKPIVSLSALVTAVVSTLGALGII